MNKKTVKKNICPIKDCDRVTHENSKYCIFHASAEEKTEDDFRKALKIYVDKIKKEDGDYKFEGFIFIGDINFKKDLNVTIFKNANFKEVTFWGEVDFEDAVFGELANFFNATFRGYAFYKGATFGKYPCFRGAIFEGYANFQNATLGEKSSFRAATFERGACFVETTFGKKTDFNEAKSKGFTEFNATIFRGAVDFRDAVFGGWAIFWDAVFEADANFRLKHLADNLDFKRIKLASGKEIKIKINNKRGKIFFERACLENTYLELEIVEGVLIDFTGALLRNTKIERDSVENHILEEKWNNYHEAKENYLLIKNNFHSIGQYEDESWAFKKEKDMERKSHWYFSVKKGIKENIYYEGALETLPDPIIEKNKSIYQEKEISFFKWIIGKHFKKWFYSVVANIVYAYGEGLWNVVITAGVLIILFACLFTLVGIGNPETIELHGKIHPIPGTDMRIASEGVLKNTKIMQFSNSLYFSLITFTTLGYGDLRPLEGWGRILAGSEAFIGAFMMALFVYTFARRTGGR